MVSLALNEKSYFERNVIEAFMLDNPKDLYEKLSLLYDHLNNDTQNQENFNRNIVDKFSRIIERKYINVNILVAKIFEILISSQEQIDFLSDDPDLIIRISNCILNLLENIKSTLVYKSLEMKCTRLLNYLTKLNLSELQKTMLQELLDTFPTRNHSNIYRNFDKISDNILKLLNSDKYEEMAQAVSLLIESFSDTFSLDEQFELLEYFPKIIAVLGSKPNKKDLKEIYYQFSNFYCSILFATKFNLEANTDGYFINSNELNKNKVFLLKNSNLINEYTKNQLSFLHNTGYELTSQKQLLLNYNQICEMTVKLVEILLIFEEFFDLQYISYLLLKRIYYNFPRFIIFIEDLLVKVLFNLCHFKFQNDSEFINESKVFIKYIVRSKNVEESLKAKVKSLLNSYKLDLSKVKDIDFNDIEREPLILNNFNLKVGSPYSLEIDASNSESHYLEVYYPNSIIYIAFAIENKDISFEILKYEYNDSFNSIDNVDDDKDNRKFKSILRLDYIEHSSSPIKFILFVSQPGLYKIIWDNTYSWFTKKKIRYRVSVLKPCEENVEKEENKTETKIFEENKNVLILIHNNKTCDFNVDEINKKINAVKKNEEFYMSIAVLVRENFLMIFDTKLKFYLEYKYSNEESKTFLNFCEESIFEFINQQKNTEQLVLFINIFLMDKNIKDARFFENEESKFALKKNHHVYNSIFVDSCLLYHIYQLKLNDNEILHNIIYIHIDKNKPQVSMQFEGVINNKIKEIKYDCSKSLEQNIKVLNEMISHLVALFGNFDLVFSFMDYAETEILSFINLLSDNLTKNLKGKVKVEWKTQEFLYEVMNYSHLVIPNS